MKNNARVIMERKLKRKLLPTEIVHHKDGNQHNDNPSNLYLCQSPKEHRQFPKKQYKITNDDILSLINKSKNLEISSFRKALQCFFSNRQIQIILRRLNNQKLSKTETEMFSRSIKKKLIALSNNSLYDIANTMIGD